MAFSVLDPISDLFGITGDDPGAAFELQGLQQYQGLDVPSAEDLQVQLQKMVYQGDITPEQAQAIMQDPSKFNSISVNPAGRSAQLQALAQLQGISSQGGMTTQDKAQLEDIQSQLDQSQRGSREAILQNARERGVGGSGAELAAQLMNQQNSATNANKQGLGVAANAQQRALDAILQSGQLGGQIQGQQFQEEAQKAAAQDAINKFNTANRQDVVNRNIAAQNEALYRNQDMKQKISDQNTQISNDQSKANAAAKQQAYENEMNKSKAMAGGYSNLAQGKRSTEQSKIAAQGQLLALGAGAYTASKNKPTTNNYFMSSDENKKENIEDIDMDQFLESLHPKSYRYKDPNARGAEDGENVGVIAQDVEQTPVGKTMVKNTGDGKMLDMHKGFGVILAALAALNDKIEQEKGDSVNA